MNKLFAVPAIALVAGISLTACGSQPHSAAPAPKAAATQAAGGCSQINSTLNSVFNGDYAGLLPAKTTGDLLNNFLGQTNPVTSALASIVAEKGTAPGLKSAESKLNDDVNTLENTSYVTDAQSAVLIPDLKAIGDICRSASWTGVTLEVDAPGGNGTTPTTAPTTPAPTTPAVTYPAVTAAQWGDISRNPDAHKGETYTISGTVSEYNINSNTFATVENAALTATDSNGNAFVLEADSSLLGNVQPGQTFTAEISVIGSVSATNTLGGGTSLMPDLDAKTFHITG